MFLNKIVGAARESLLEQLDQYYRLGVSCLLLSPTIRSILEPALYNLSLVIPSSEGQCNDISCNDGCILREIVMLRFDFYDEVVDVKHFIFKKSVDTVLHLSLSPYQSVTLQYLTADCLVQAAFMIVNSVHYFKHKYVYCLDRKICNMLKLSLQVGTIPHSLYLALYYHRTGRYNEALYITNQTKRRLSEPHVMHNGMGDSYRYREYVSGLSLSKRIKNAWVLPIIFHPKICYIEELTLEQLAAFQHSRYLQIPPCVIVEMLSVLSHNRLGNRSQCLQSLTDLQTLMLYDDERYVPLERRSISWQILGICQQVVGDLHGALQSYEVSLKQEPFHFIQEATNSRIEWVKQQLQRDVDM
ncbi:uncharacterized protein LOC134270768 [Saccostrea cucullata]|uniref:uncharacterized protein LOC134270768 n=1 Tax=Saccostrea cuccullata TaxID=36930 RepID=UPI002ED04029